MTKENTKTIIICDDDEGILDVASIVLEEKGYEVIALSNSKEVIQIAEAKNTSLILVDLWMPGLSGEEITKKIKGNEKTKHIPVVVISARRDVEETANKIGADSFICKPFNIEELEKVVEKYVK